MTHFVVTVMVDAMFQKDIASQVFSHVVTPNLASALRSHLTQMDGVKIIKKKVQSESGTEFGKYNYTNSNINGQFTHCLFKSFASISIEVADNVSYNQYQFKRGIEEALYQVMPAGQITITTGYYSV